MDVPTQDVPGYYVWEVPGKPVIVHLSLSVVDELSVDVMRGFGAVRKRGAEIGGLLLGSVIPGDPAIVRVEAYHPVPCEYRRGPSYLFAEEDSFLFEEAYETCQPVGYFRSHTRDGFELCDDDLELLDHFFVAPESIALVIRPYASRISTAAILVRENGRFEMEPSNTFPFRRHEMLGGTTPRRTLLERVTPERFFRASASPSGETAGSISGYAGASASATGPRTGFTSGSEWDKPVDSGSRFDSSFGERSSVSPLAATDKSAPGKRPGNWVWMPLSFSFLILGGVLGFEAARTMDNRPVAATQYSVGLTVAKSDANLNLRWDGQSPLLRAAQRGLLEIEDGDSRKTLPLDAAQLHSGSLTYHNASKTVRFRLTAYPDARVAVAETADWKE